MEAVEFIFSAIGGALITVGVAMLIRPARMVGIAGRRADGRRPTADEIVQTRILGVGFAAIGVFTLYMVVSHRPCRACLAAPVRHVAGSLLFPQSADAARIRLVD